MVSKKKRKKSAPQKNLKVEEKCRWVNQSMGNNRVQKRYIERDRKSESNFILAKIYDAIHAIFSSTFFFVVCLCVYTPCCCHSLAYHTRVMSLFSKAVYLILELLKYYLYTIIILTLIVCIAVRNNATGKKKQQKFNGH